MARGRKELEPGVVRGDFHSITANGRVRCDVCPRGCTLRDGQRAFCFVREARDGHVVLTSYGRSTGFCVDPIEKKPLNHFFPGSAVMSFGTAGCNLGCRFCQNWSTSRARDVARMSARATPEAVAEAAVRAGCQSVAFTYNDPVIFLEYAVDTAEACHDRGIQTVAVTAGYVGSQARSELFRHMDAANVDLKAFREDFYHRYCAGHLEPVLDTLRFIKQQTDVWLEITTLLIPGANDSEDEIGRMVDWIAESLGPDVPLHFSAFHPDFKTLDRPRTPSHVLARARRQALGAGLRHVYTGNVHDAAGQSTYCPGCGTVVIERDGYELGAWKLDGDRCQGCGTRVAGRFADRPGSWGSRRMPIRIGR